MIKLSNQRLQKGKQIAERHDQIQRIDDIHYKVNSQNSDKQYEVISTEFGWTCSCPDHTFRKICCKHIHAVEISLKIRKHVKSQTTINPIKTNCCKFCNSDNIIKKGLRKNKNQDIQVYFCKDCNRKFSINLGFEKMHASPQSITSALQLYFTGESLRGVQKFLKLQGMNFSHVAIYEWIKKYTKLMDNYLRTITPKVGDKWHADEVWLKINGDKKYLFAMMDSETRFWIAQEVANSKFKHDARTLLKTGKKKTDKTPKTFITDGLPAYHDAFKKEFWTLRNPRSRHVKEIHLKDQMANNNIQERLNGEFRDREKVFRGLKKDDSIAITGIQLYHNYIREHMSLDGDTPADRAGIIINGNNKWLTIIQNAQVSTLYRRKLRSKAPST